MRAVTATEKFRAVNEGKMAKKEFVRQMRQEFPQYISQFNGFKDSVSILKNKGLIFETKPTGVEIYDERPAATVDLTRLERGIFYELQAAGLKPPFDERNVTTDEYLKAAKKAKDNLIKNPNHYIDIVAGESSNVDKHDREVPVKRGELKKDLFNDLKKAQLKEAKVMLKEGRLDDLAETLGISLERLQAAVSSIREIEDEVVGEVEDEVGEVMGIDRKGNKKPESGPSNYTKAEGTPILKEVIASAIGRIKEKYGEIKGIDMLIKEFIKTHFQDLMDGADPIDEFNEFVSVNYPGPSDMMGADGLNEEEKEIEHDCANHVLHEKYGHGICLEGQHTLLEDGTVTHYDVFFKEGSKTVKDIPITELQIINSSHHGHKRRKNEGEYAADKYNVNVHGYQTRYFKICPGAKAFFEKILAGEIGEEYNKEEAIRLAKMHDLLFMYEIKALKDSEYAAGILESAEYLVSVIKDQVDTMGLNVADVDYLDSHIEKIKDAAKGVDEKKGKDHDGDGDIDSDDYMAAKDKAIKKAMGKEDEKNEQLKEAIKTIIKKSLNEDTLNEAATQELAALADTYGGYKGMQVILNDLQNIVTDIESYQAKTKEKLQNVFNKVGDVENEDGLKVGAFLAPAIESAFNKDSRMVGGSRLMKGVEIPKVKFMPKDIETPQNEESPKQTVFAPVKRYF